MAEEVSKPGVEQGSVVPSSKPPALNSKLWAWPQVRPERCLRGSPEHVSHPLELPARPAASEEAAWAARVAAKPRLPQRASPPLPGAAPRRPRSPAALRRAPNLPAETRCPTHFPALQIPGQSEKVREPSAVAVPRPRALPCSSACCRVPAAEYPTSRSNFLGRNALTGICSHGNSP